MENKHQSKSEQPLHNVAITITLRGHHSISGGERLEFLSRTVLQVNYLFHAGSTIKYLFKKTPATPPWGLNGAPLEIAQFGIHGRTNFEEKNTFHHRSRSPVDLLRNIPRGTDFTELAVSPNSAANEEKRAWLRPVAQPLRAVWSHRPARGLRLCGPAFPATPASAGPVCQ